MTSRLLTTIAVLCLCLSAVTVTRSARLSTSTADWPQWRGPQRNGVSQETGLLKQSAPPSLPARHRARATRWSSRD